MYANYESTSKDRVHLLDLLTDFELRDKKEQLINESTG